MAQTVGITRVRTPCGDPLPSVIRPGFNLENVYDSAVHLQAVLAETEDEEERRQIQLALELGQQVLQGREVLLP